MGQQTALLELSTAAVVPNAQLPHDPSGCTLAEVQQVPSDIITVPEGHVRDAYRSAIGVEELEELVPLFEPLTSFA